jgi:hypothetical protein
MPAHRPGGEETQDGLSRTAMHPRSGGAGGANPIDRNFKLVFLSLLVLVAAFAVGASLLSVVAGNQPQVAKVSDGLLELTKLGVALLAGLISGRSLH